MDELEIIDCKADIFSFGLIIYETISLVPPHTLDLGYDNDHENSNTSNFADNSGVELEEAELCEGACGTRPPLPQAFELTDEYNIIMEIFYCCTNEIAEDRPTAGTIWTMLQNVNATDKENQTNNAIIEEGIDK